MPFLRSNVSRSNSGLRRLPPKTKSKAWLVSFSINPVPVAEVLRLLLLLLLCMGGRCQEASLQLSPLRIALEHIS